MSKYCDFKVGEIAVFDSCVRNEIFISKIMQIHIDYSGLSSIKIRKATSEEKKMWYDNNAYELILAPSRI